MIAHMGDSATIGERGSFQAFLGQSGGSNRQVKDLCNAGTNDAGVRLLVPIYDIICTETGLLVCRTGEGDGDRAP